MVWCDIQVRSTGTIDQVTRQPIKGRKRGGGIRFGEMERDSMLAHGAAYLLHDRLHACSDYHIADVCSLCGSILTTTFHQQQKRIREIGGLPPIKSSRKVTCHACQTGKGMEKVAMPYVFRYLASELASMNIKMTLQVSDSAGAWGRRQFWHSGFSANVYPSLLLYMLALVLYMIINYWTTPKSNVSEKLAILFPFSLLFFSMIFFFLFRVRFCNLFLQMC